MAIPSIGYAVAFTADSYYMNGYRHDRTRAFTNFSDLLHAIREHNTLEEAVVLLDEDVMNSMGIARALTVVDDDYVIHHPSLTAARAEGWNVTELSPWMTFWARGIKSVHVGLLPFLNRNSFPAYSRELGPMTYALKRLHDMIGVPYRMTPGTTFIGMVRDGAPRRHEPLWKPKWSDYEDADSLKVAWELPYQWASQEPNPFEVLWEYDVNKQYLAAMSNADLATDALIYHPRGFGSLPEFFEPGWYEFEVPAWNFPTFPHPAGQNAVPGTVVRRTAPTMVLLAHLADRGFIAEPTVLRRWTSAKHGRLLRGTAEKIRDMITASAYEDAATAPVLHEIGAGLYKRGHGMLRTAGSRVERYDWADTIAGMARNNLFRAIWAVYQQGGPAPLAIAADTVSYAGISRDPSEAIESAPLELSNKIGKWKFRSINKDLRDRRGKR